jgi:DNA-binding response OmpR family regulator
MRIVIADDDRATRMILQRSLERWGYQVEAVENGRAAWEAIRSAPPPFALLDWMMPEVDGLEVCRRVRAEIGQPYIYLLLMTATERRAAVIEGLDAGADDYLIKPLDTDELQARLRVGQRLLDALAHVKQLRGLLPICSYCKSIRSDEDSWQQLEAYVSQHSDAEFSHGICPACLERVTKDFEGKGHE